jgi:hypothetical protein
MVPAGCLSPLERRKAGVGASAPNRISWASLSRPSTPASGQLLGAVKAMELHRCACRAHVEAIGPPVAFGLPLVSCFWADGTRNADGRDHPDPPCYKTPVIPLQRYMCLLGCVWGRKHEAKLHVLLEHCRLPRGLGVVEIPKEVARGTICGGYGQGFSPTFFHRLIEHCLPTYRRASNPQQCRQLTTHRVHSSCRVARPAPLLLTESGRWQQGHDVCGFLPSRSLFE